MASTRAETDPEPARRAPRRRWVPLLALAGTLLVYVGIFQVPALLPRGPAAGKLLVSRWESGDWLEVQDGVEVPAGTRVRFTVVLERPAWVVLLGLAPNGRVTLYVPAKGSPPRLGPGTAVVGEAVLDAVPGAELLLAVLCNTALPPETVVKAGERAAAAASEPVQVQTLDLGCPEARFRIVQAATH
jgi:hypothetical protein